MLGHNLHQGGFNVNSIDWERIHPFIFNIPTEDVCFSLMSFISHHTGLTDGYISFHVKIINTLCCV